MYLNRRYATKSRADQHYAKLALHSSLYLPLRRLYLLIGYRNRRHVGKRVAPAKSELLYRSLAEIVVVQAMLVQTGYHDTYNAGHTFKQS
jgi:hypothetical protein